jgi:hypothetical protein|tara:strand:- start:546 stop:827 length:282 start_codon:yes stop_codon:yes gene_type:complete
LAAKDARAEAVINENNLVFNNQKFEIKSRFGNPFNLKVSKKSFKQNGGQEGRHSRMNTDLSALELLRQHSIETELQLPAEPTGLTKETIYSPS